MASGVNFTGGTSSSGTSLRLGGISTGLDTNTIIQKILDADRIPEGILKNQKKVLDVRNTAVSSIMSSLANLKAQLTTLKDSSFYNSSIATSSDTSIATVSAATTAAKNTYSVNITSLASASVLRSGTSLGPAAQKISNPITPGSLLTDDTSYGSSLTLGTFAVNGAMVTIDGTDTLNTALAKINAATGGIVSGVYNAATDTITLTSTGSLVLGSPGDTSNFLSRSRLYTNGTNTATSLTSVGNIDTNQVLSSTTSRIAASAGLTTGDISINGVSVSIDKDNDTLQDVLDRITASTAGVYASYDSIEDRITLTSKTTGSLGIVVADGTSNFASSMKLTAATSQLTAGDDTTFTVNGGVTRKSTDLTINETESGISGLTMNVANTGSIVVNVATDTSSVQKAIANFVDQFNSVQNQITSFSLIPSADTQPDDPSSILANDFLVSSLGVDLRKLVTASQSTGTIRSLEDLGVASSSTNDLLSVTDPSKLTSALSNNIDEVITLFTDSTTGIMNTLDDFLDSQTDPVSGSFSNRLSEIAKKQSDLDDDIERIENTVSQHEQMLIKSFGVLEQFQSRANTILDFLKQNKS